MESSLKGEMLLSSVDTVLTAEQRWELHTQPVEPGAKKCMGETSPCSIRASLKDMSCGSITIFSRLLYHRQEQMVWKWSTSAYTFFRPRLLGLSVHDDDVAFLEEERWVLVWGEKSV